MIKNFIHVTANDIKRATTTAQSTSRTACELTQLIGPADGRARRRRCRL